MTAVRSVRALVASLVCAGCCLGCVACGTTTPDPSAYREQARLAVGTALSEVRTVELLLRSERDGKVLGGYGATVLRSSGDSLDKAQQTLGGLLPPPAEDATAGRTSTVLQQAGDDVTAVSVAVHRGDRASYAGLLRRLDRTATALTRVQGQLQ